MESEENIYSKEFIERLNNQQLPSANSGSVLKNPNTKLFVIIGLVVAVVLALVGGFSYLSSQRASRKLSMINNLNDISNQSLEITKSYQNSINDVKIRVINEHFFQSLPGLTASVKQYIEKTYTKEQKEDFKKHKVLQKQAIKEITDRLRKADLNESLTRIYTQELNALIQQNIDQIHQIIQSGYYKKHTEFIKSMEEHYAKFLKIQTEITELEEAKLKAQKQP